MIQVSPSIGMKEERGRVSVEIEDGALGWS